MKIKHVVPYVGHLNKPLWTTKIDRVGRGGSKKVKIWLRMGAGLTLEAL